MQREAPPEVNESNKLIRMLSVMVGRSYSSSMVCMARLGPGSTTLPQSPGV